MKNKWLSIGALFLSGAFAIVLAQIAYSAPQIESPARPLLAWTIAADSGAVFVLDATNSVYRLAPGDLSPQAQSPPLFEAPADAPAHLLTDAYLFVGSEAISQTLVLNRRDFSQVAALGRAGPMALDPGRRLFMISECAVWAYDLANLGQPPLAAIPAPRMCYGHVPLNVVADPAARRLYVLFVDNTSSPPHTRQFYTSYNLDTLADLGEFQRELGTLTRPAIAERAGLMIVTLYGKSGFNELLILDREGQELKRYGPLDGVPATNADGAWIYLLRERGLWVLRGSNLALTSIMPFTETPPQDLALSPDGKTLYLFGNGWLTALSTADLQALGILPVSPFPVAWTYPDEYESFQPRLYPSPEMEKDGVAFVVVGGYAEIYRTTDGGRSWRLLLALTYPDFKYVGGFSLSPDFATDYTLVAHAGGVTPILRSIDGGDTWEVWTPRIAFVSDRNGDREIYTMNQEGEELRRLTDNPAAEENPAWSPAWTRLAFQSDRNGNWDIYSVRADCAPAQPDAAARCDLRQLTDDPGDDMLPAWSPDGRSIAFVSTRDGNPEIYVMARDGGNQRRLTFNPTGDWRPAWMPDSRHLVFTSDRSGNNDIYMLTVPPPDAAPLTAELELTSIVTDPADDRDPAVDGYGRLLFLSDRDGVMKAYTLDLRYSYSQAYPVTDTDQPEGHPCWTSEYYILVAAERDGDSNIYRAIYPDTYTPLAPSPYFDGHPAWGPTWWVPETSASREWLMERR